MPFNLLGAVESMSRDWVISKIAIGATDYSDLTLVKKLINRSGSSSPKTLNSAR
jgi:hypothetical protein